MKPEIVFCFVLFCFSNTDLGVPLVESLDVQELLLVVGSGRDRVHLGPNDELDVVADVPFAVLVGDRGHLALVALYERILVLELVSIFVLFLFVVVCNFYS